MDDNNPQQPVVSPLGKGCLHPQARCVGLYLGTVARWLESKTKWVQVDKTPIQGIKLQVMKEFNIPWLNRDYLDYYLSANKKVNDNKENKLEPHLQLHPWIWSPLLVSLQSQMWWVIWQIMPTSPRQCFHYCLRTPKLQPTQTYQRLKALKPPEDPRELLSKVSLTLKFNSWKQRTKLHWNAKKLQEKGSHVKRGSYKKVINQSKVRFNLPEDIKINKQSMVKWGATANHQVLVAKWGPVLPMQVVEEHILSIIFHAEIVKDPMMPKKIINFSNSLIWSSIYEKNVKDWNKNLPKNKVIGEVGQKWWQNV